MDISIARFIGEYWEIQEEEERERLRKQYDPKERITYTLEELIEGIKKGRQYIYTLRLEFESKELLEGRITIPFIKNFYDVVDDEPGVALLASNEQKVVLNVSDAPCAEAKGSMDEWIATVKGVLKEMNMYMKPEKKAVTGNMEYVCYVLPTVEGRLYNVAFRMQKRGRVYAGNLNCPEEDRKGMGLLLEAMVHVIEEMNR